MKRINIKNKRVAELLEQVVLITNENKTDAVMHALTLYLKLEASKRADAAIKFVREEIHPNLEPEQLGRAPSKKEQEELLGL